MSGQATLNGGKPMTEETPARAVARNTGEFLHDLVTLGELQLRLVFIDGQESARGLVWPIAMLVTGAGLALATMPVALIALAVTLTEVARFTPAQAAGIATLVGFVLALLVVGVGWWALKSPRPNAFDRSGREWRQNLKWIKDALQKSVSDRSRAQTGPNGRYSNN